ncbi:hypothetical protein GCM10011381_33260 [Klenkia taihuensis]|nr:hypothetical protein GCM10011381_33260 [Klenkia taihuensis]
MLLGHGGDQAVGGAGEQVGDGGVEVGHVLQCPARLQRGGHRPPGSGGRADLPPADGHRSRSAAGSSGASVQLQPPATGPAGRACTLDAESTTAVVIGPA